MELHHGQPVAHQHYNTKLIARKWARIHHMTGNPASYSGSIDIIVYDIYGYPYPPSIMLASASSLSAESVHLLSSEPMTDGEAVLAKGSS